MEARHDDLDLTQAEDRSIYRTRVDEEFRLMKFANLAAEANRLGGRPGMGTRGFQTRLSATLYIANCRIMAVTGEWPR